MPKKVYLFDIRSKDCNQQRVTDMFNAQNNEQALVAQSNADSPQRRMIAFAQQFMNGGNRGFPAQMASMMMPQQMMGNQMMSQRALFL